MKLVFAILLIVTMFLTSSFLHATVAYQSPTSATPSICDQKCAVRCSNAGYKPRCMTYCGICCNKCNNCVPSGTFGNKSECPCYRDMLNSKGKPKCP